MAEELENEVTQQQTLTPEDQNLMEEFQHLKENSVPKEEYDRVVNRNKALTQNWARGQSESQTPKDTDTVESLRKDLFAEDRAELSNLETAQKMLKLRSILIEEGKPDPFVSTDKGTIDALDIDTANRVAAGLQKMVEESKGDNEIFNAKLGRQVDGGLSSKRKYNY